MRDPVKTRALLLDTAYWEIYRHGFQGVSIDDILKKTPLTKGAFFHYFPTKNDLGYAIIDEVIRPANSKAWVEPFAAYKNPIQGILQTLRKYIETASDDSIELGCPINNLVQEMSNVDPIFREKLNAVLELWITGVENHLKRAQEAEFLKKDVSPRHVAEFVVMTHEGAAGMSKSFRDKKMFFSLYQSLREYLRSVSEERN